MYASGVGVMWCSRRNSDLINASYGSVLAQALQINHMRLPLRLLGMWIPAGDSNTSEMVSLSASRPCRPNHWYRAKHRGLKGMGRLHVQVAKLLGQHRRCTTIVSCMASCRIMHRLETKVSCSPHARHMQHVSTHKYGTGHTDPYALWHLW